MTERNTIPGPDWGNPEGPNQDRIEGADGTMQQVRSALRTPGGKLLAVIPAVLTLVVGGAVGTALGGGSTKANTVTSPDRTEFVTVTATAPATGPSSPAGSGSGSTSASSSPGTPTGTTGATQPPNAPGGNPTQVGVVPLVDLTPASGPWKSTDANPMINGLLQQFAIIQDIPDENANGDVGYNLGRDYTRLTGQLGLDDNSPKSTLHPTIEIDGDGLKIATFTPTLGHPAQINLDVNGVLRLDIKYTSLDSSNFGNTAGMLVLGNGQLTTVPGYHPPTPSSS